MSAIIANSVQVNQSLVPAQNIHIRSAGAQDFRLSTGNVGTPLVDELIIDTTSVRLPRLELSASTKASVLASNPNLEGLIFFLSAI